MKLNEIKSMTPRGTYFGVKPTRETIEAMQEFMHTHNVPNPLTPDKMHATVVYSRAFVGARPLGQLDPTWKGKFDAYDLFPRGGPVNESEEPAKCLVMKFKCPEMHQRHHFLRKHHGATHDFPDFSPHMTMTYDAGDFDHKSLPHYGGPHEFDTEYSEPLDLNWVK